jgi:hypothetical protein
LACLADELDLVCEKTNAHSSWDPDTIFYTTVAISLDGTKIVSGSYDRMIKVWDFGALEPSNHPSFWPLLTLVGLPGRQTGAVEREDGLTQRLHLVGGVFLGRDQDRVGIVRQDVQSLGFW